ncbi:MAG TPA: glycoside hydrolase family 43 protein, partial [Pyrinomonadaceae bacterium]|nr:glycoside hydrolase family 43 protein [Pyrinomonadaceae bacterium]
MTAFASPAGPATYSNPVYNSSFPDPFVLKFGGTYFAYCTGHWKDGNVFGVLQSSNLVDWREIGGAMRPLDSDAPYYWAPEVTYHAGKFYLYYSVGNETLMEIRLAVSDRPEGGFTDAGVRLTFAEFAIDPHVFTDRDGSRYMFYATDFLEHTHIGTGTVVDRMLAWDKLEGAPRPVTRAKYDWQVYDPQRKEKGGVRWHTVEGPFVLERKGRYYEMFSGGNWQNTTYGVSFASSDSVMTAGEWEQFSDGAKVLPILRTVPERIVGPGHNCVVYGPNNRELYCVYHRWTEAGRVLSIDRMDFAGDRIFIIGATDTPQPAPFPPKIRDPFDTTLDTSLWECEGEWKLQGGEAVCEFAEKSSLTCRTPQHYLSEVTFRGVKTVNGGAVTFRLAGGGANLCEFSVQPNMRQAAIIWMEANQTREEVFSLADFSVESAHTLRLEVDGRKVRFRIDGGELAFSSMLGGVADRLSLTAAACSVGVSEFALTEGFEELFDGREFEPSVWGWNIIADGTELSSAEFRLVSAYEGETVFGRAVSHRDFELAVNIRLAGPTTNCKYGLRLTGEDLVLEGIEIDPSRRAIRVASGGSEQNGTLPEAFDANAFSQLRILRLGDSVTFFVDANALGNLPADGGERGFEIFCRNGSIALDMVR